MYLTHNIEVSGITRIVVLKAGSERLYTRQLDRDWLDNTSGKIVSDTHMASRVRRMLKKDIDAVLSNGVPCRAPYWRMWIHNETLNFEKMYYY